MTATCYDAEKRAALDFWDRHLDAIVNGRRTLKVLQFAARTYGFGDDHVNRVLIDILTMPSTHLVTIVYGLAARLKSFCASSQLAGKAAASFALYRAAGASRGRGGSTRRGGTPFAPHHLDRL